MYYFGSVFAKIKGTNKLGKFSPNFKNQMAIHLSTPVPVFPEGIGQRMPQVSVEFTQRQGNNNQVATAGQNEPVNPCFISNGFPFNCRCHSSIAECRQLLLLTSSGQLPFNSIYSFSHKSNHEKFPLTRSKFLKNNVLFK
jgi:hypothetical protein